MGDSIKELKRKLEIEKTRLALLSIQNQMEQIILTNMPENCKQYLYFRIGDANVR